VADTGEKPLSTVISLGSPRPAPTRSRTWATFRPERWRSAWRKVLTAKPSTPPGVRAQRRTDAQLPGEDPARPHGGVATTGASAITVLSIDDTSRARAELVAGQRSRLARVDDEVTGCFGAESLRALCRRAREAREV
jgi:hypothetical protein